MPIRPTVGVGGGTGEEDAEIARVEIARAGIAALMQALEGKAER